jgi:hypothetical protein
LALDLSSVAQIEQRPHGRQVHRAARNH